MMAEDTDTQEMGEVVVGRNKYIISCKEEYGHLEAPNE